MSDRLWWSSSSGAIELEFERDQAYSVPMTGAADAAVEILRSEESLVAQFEAISDETLRSELREYGAWEEHELLDRDANLDRIIWLAALNIQEEENAELSEH